MGSKHFENRVRREWWSLHIEACRRSGIEIRRYCRQHRLGENTFRRWLSVLADARTLQAKAELLREERRQRRRKRRIRLSTDMRSKAVQAYWAMHVEAMNWSGMGLQAYAWAHGISRYSLRRWRDLIDANEVEIDWRTHVHPSALPRISSGISSAAKEAAAEQRLTASPISDPPSGRANRRRFTDEEKLAIVTESELPGATAAEVCRRNGIVTSMLFRWRVQFGFSKRATAKLASVNIPGAQSGPFVLHDLLQPPDGTTVIELTDGRRVFAPIGSDPDTVRRHVIEQETAR
ncbi:IS66 family insertion sequence element accessory protein TnpA [Bradyrhizobium elkanii]|uniref:IS66 family insertion sequence element accessory protein TnpA n=1 Tax=Bradyrhizobium elkanii TaxID=29448 RepID=UPI0004AE4143|nr:transposase [Bradyrhizobium elkanii]MCS3524484.1 transposase-like protein [Bradyrhizobium elkanii]MCS4072140.1 transposase-like protein [Bradyrhizobium elkanii]MCS4078773.1 transposase-like protein [Bradyrhizobium elkanii]MCW2122628.1 transposase-like protein [Bradyrhizobium elkanii]MCW2169375.1 transposase-like protein [Bradyrhizobium elkanii]